MNITTRIQRSRGELVGQLTLADGRHAFVVTFRDWIRRSARRVSRLVDESLDSMEGVRLFLDGAPEDLPLPITAVELIQSGSELRNPTEFSRHIDTLCRRLAIFVREDDCCPRCEGDLEMWSSPRGEVFDLCKFLGCALTVSGAAMSHIPQHSRPANRAQVLARYPTARLLL